MRADADRFADLFIHFGPVSIRRMFGGSGVFAGETMIGLISDDVIFFKTNANSREAYLAEACRPFSFVKRKTGKTIATSYYAVPDRLYDDPEEFARWAQAACDAALKRPDARKVARKSASKRPARESPKRPRA